MIILNKILPLLVLPLGIALILLCVGIWKGRRMLSWSALLLLWIASTPLVSDTLMRRVEAGAVRIPASEAVSADAIVVLSAGRVLAPGAARISEWGDPDRVLGGVELFQAGKAPLLVFTGAWIPWAPDEPLEGTVAAGFARALGVPGDQIQVTGRVSNTADEAREVKRLLDARQPTREHILLVTSAFHMPRAREQFERAGMVVTPFPVDFQISAGVAVNATQFLPSSHALARSESALREMYGRLFYRLLAR